MKGLIVLVLLGTALFFSACYPRDIVHTQRAIERDLPDTRFRRQVAMSFGPGSLGLAKWITSKVDQEDSQNVSAYLEEVDRIQFGVYETDNLPTLSEVELPSRLQRKLDNEGWELAATVREAETLVWVLYKEDGQTVRDLFAVVLDEDRLILVSLGGNLNELMARVVEDHKVIPELIPGAG
jgi:hypothetical protein